MYLVAAAVAAAQATPASSQGADAWTISPEPIMEVGVLEGDTAYVFGAVQAARLLPDGRIAVADRKTRTLRVFSSSGDYQVGMGGHGEGPGEFGHIVAMWVRPPDTIQALDLARPGITTYLADGTLVGTKKIDAAPPRGVRGLLDIGVGRFEDGDLVLGWTAGRVSGSDGYHTDRIIIGRFRADGSLRHLLGEGNGIVRYRGSPVVFSPYPQFTIFRDTMYFTNGDGTEISVWDPEGGGVVRTLEVPGTSMSVPEAWAELEQTLDAPRVERLRRRGRRDRTPSAAGIRADDADYLWVKAYDPATDCIYVDGPPPGTGGEWWVLTPDGSAVTTVKVPDGVVPMDIQGDRLLGLTRDALDVERLVVHRIRR